eukprot:GEMP01019087.1.p1 GENE.GEMP01019087.1~~GEMP01019087.1.p1  ORF type:complete len:556 (+),score=149.55 GEMP01019087.1:128-1795(+)
MAELRAYMLQRAKVPAKVHAMDAPHVPDRFGSVQSDRLSSSPPRVVLPRVDNHFAPHSGGHGDGSQAAIATSASKSSPGRRKSRPYNEPAAHKSTSSKHHVVPSNGSTKYHTARSISTIHGSTNAAVRRCRQTQFGAKASTSRDDYNSCAGTYKTTRSSRGSTLYADENGSVVSHASQTPNYGKVPRYLQKMKSDRVREKQRVEEEAEKIVPPHGFRQVSEEERLASLAHLAKQKEDLEAELFRRAPFRSETLGQQSRERKLNDSTKRVEEGIRLFSKEIVFIPADCEPLTSVLPPTRGKNESDDDDVSDAFHDEDSRHSPAKQHREPDSNAQARRIQNVTEFEEAHRRSTGDHERQIEKKGHDDLPTHKRQRAARPPPFASDDPQIPPPPPALKNRTHPFAYHDDVAPAPAPPPPLDRKPPCPPCGTMSPYRHRPQGQHSAHDDGVSAQPSPNRRRESPLRDDDSTMGSRNERVKANHRFEWEHHIDEGEDVPARKKESPPVTHADKGKNTVHYGVNDDNETSHEQMQRKGMGMEGRRIGQPPGGRSSICLQWD